MDGAFVNYGQALDILESAMPPTLLPPEFRKNLILGISLVQDEADMQGKLSEDRKDLVTAARYFRIAIACRERLANVRP